MIYTFYSYKGGVGRSMALANVAEWFCQQCLRVIIIDWDLEAPGIESYFYGDDEKRQEVRRQLGLIDMLLAYRRRYAILLEQEEVDTEQQLVSSWHSILSDNLPPISSYLYPIHVPQGTSSSLEGGLWLLPAGWRDRDRFAAYAEAVQTFGWEEFYAEMRGEDYFNWLRAQLLDTGLADVVLIDSRTGISEMGGVSTRQLADVVVLFSAPNNENLAGTLMMAESFCRPDVIEARTRPLEVIVAPTRIENSEIDARTKFEGDFKRKTDKYLPAVMRNVRREFWDLRIPYIPKYSYAETLAVGVEGSAEELTSAYEKLALHLGLLAPAGSSIYRQLSLNIEKEFDRKLVVASILYSGNSSLQFAETLEAIFLRKGISTFRNPGAATHLSSLISSSTPIHAAVVLLVSQAALKSTRVQEEWRSAFERGAQLYPILMDKTDGVRVGQLPSWLASLRTYRESALSTLPALDSLVDDILRPQTASRIPFMVPDPPGYFVGRERELVELQQTLLFSLEDGRMSSSSTVVITGMAGIGKTALASVFCHKHETVDTFTGGILWVTLGPSPSVEAELRRVYLTLTGDVPMFIDVDDAVLRVSEKLFGRTCLLVLEDVYEVDHLEPFLRACKSCALIITTRYPALGAKYKTLALSGLDRAESIQLLTDGLEGSQLSVDTLGKLMDRLFDHPLTVALANSFLLERQSRGANIEESLVYLQSMLEKRHLRALDLPKSTARQNLAHSFELSLRDLLPDERAHYEQLSIFPPGADVPLQLVQAIWQLDLFDTTYLLDSFARSSLIDYDLARSTIRLHGVFRDLLLSMPSTTDFYPLHERILESWPDLEVLPYTYAWRWIGHHLAGAGKVNVLAQLMFEYDWLEQKLRFTDVDALIEDCERLIAANIVEGQTLYEALAASRSILIRDKQMLARMLNKELTNRTLGGGKLVLGLLAQVEERVRHRKPSAFKRRITVRDCYMRGLLSKGQSIYLRHEGKEHRAEVLDATHVVDRGQTLTFSQWAKQITGRNSIDFYMHIYVREMGIETTLAQLRLKV